MKFDEAKNRAQTLDQDALKQIQGWCAVCAESTLMSGDDIAKFAILRDALRSVRELAIRGL